MANWFYRLLVVCQLGLTIAYSNLSYAQNTEVIAPDLDRRDIKIARIDNEHIEIGVYYGIISIEDFDNSEIWNVRAAFHINEYFFIEGSYGQAKGDTTSFEELIPSAQLVSDEDRDYISWDASIGWNVFPNESWLFGKAFKSDIYLLAGLGRTDFGGDKWRTINLGMGYKLFLTDWLIYRIEVRDHIFNRNIFGENDQTNNIEISAGLSVFF